jgi:signal transduction histidine kinase
MKHVNIEELARMVRMLLDHPAKKGSIFTSVRRATSKILDPFFTTKDVGKETGQGLAISHSVIVGKHGGTIDFESQSGEGTTFVMTLPI